MARPSLQPVVAFAQMLKRYRPCQECGSGRVTVQRAADESDQVLRATCSDCGAKHTDPGKVDPT